MPSFIDPKDILKQIGLKIDSVAVDFGSGSGGWALPLAKMLEEGKVIALDVQQEPLSALQSKAKTSNLKNVETILADIEEGSPSIENNSVDLVLMTNLLFQVENKEAVFKETKRVLKTGGKVLVVDWKPGALMGPKTNVPSEDEIKRLAQESGFALVDQLEAGEYHFALIFKKQ
ncbi:class I SAM-dependent methyltransferase [Candidatus Parcubacteria bacterium]|nr:class I SAM-dependent methyltransferase [Candidatus Parcubacteria bacterium]